MSGYQRHTYNWLPADKWVGENPHVYFAMAFRNLLPLTDKRITTENKPIAVFGGKFDQNNNFPEIAGKKIRIHFDFKTEEGEK